MGYELSIQRENEKNKITIIEWKSYIESDSEFLCIDDFSNRLNDGKTLTVSTPHAGLWKTEKGEVPFIFYEKYGWISVKNPDDWIIEKMISIAKKLDAIVLGEEEELYDAEYLKSSSLKKEYSLNKKWWEFWK